MSFDESKPSSISGNLPNFDIAVPSLGRAAQCATVEVINSKQASMLRSAVYELAEILWALHMIGEYPQDDGWPPFPARLAYWARAYSRDGTSFCRPGKMSGNLTGFVYKWLRVRYGTQATRLTAAQFADAMSLLQGESRRYGRRFLRRDPDVSPQLVLDAAVSAVNAMCEPEKAVRLGVSPY